jgi:hypothetical protein
MQEKAVYIGLKVVRPFLEPYANGSYMHRADLFEREPWRSSKAVDL